MIIEVVGKEIEKIKGDYESYLNGLNMVGEISYSQYSELYDEGTKQIQKAYELGNKANEWHYVKDGDLPKENKLYFVVIKDNGLAIAYFNGLHWETRYNLGDFGHCVETVIAWKEIVLPELKESE